MKTWTVMSHPHTPHNEDQLQASQDSNLTRGGATELASQQMNYEEVPHAQK